MIVFREKIYADVTIPKFLKTIVKNPTALKRYISKSINHIKNNPMDAVKTAGNYTLKNPCLVIGTTAGAALPIFPGSTTAGCLAGTALDLAGRKVFKFIRKHIS